MDTGEDLVVDMAPSTLAMSMSKFTRQQVASQNDGKLDRDQSGLTRAQSELLTDLDMLQKGEQEAKNKLDEDKKILEKKDEEISILKDELMKLNASRLKLSEEVRSEKSMERSLKDAHDKWVIQESKFNEELAGVRKELEDTRTKTKILQSKYDSIMEDFHPPEDKFVALQR